LWAKETGILSGTSNGIQICIFNVVASNYFVFRLYIIQKKLVEIGFEKLAV